MDWILLFFVAISMVSIATLSLLGLGIWVVFRKIGAAEAAIQAKADSYVDNLLQSAPQRIARFMFVDSGAKGPEGQPIFKASEPFQALINLAMPQVIGQGIEWAKQNVKLKDVMPAVVGGDGGLGSVAGIVNGPVGAAALKQMGIPKELQGILGFAMQYGPKLFQMFGNRGGGSNSPRSSGGGTKLTMPEFGK